MMKGLKHLFYGRTEMGLFRLETRRLWEDHTVAFWYSKGVRKETGEGHFSRVCRDRTRCNGFKKEFHLD